jgi:ABC-type transport system involved in multi-copper enzyme maturation permease subunit
VSEGQAIDAPRAPARTGWVSAFRGLWLLTWRSRLTLRQLPARLGTLLVLPLLVYVTIIATGQAPRRQVSSGVAYVELLNFSRHLEREGMPLTPSNSQALGRVLAEEAQEGELTWHEQLGESSDDRGQRLKDHVADWDGRFLSHVKALLDDRQYEEFQAIERRHRGEVLRGLTKVSIRWSRAEQFYYWLIKFYFFLILPLTCVSGCGPLIRDELQADTLGFLITRPVDRAQLLVLKYAAQIAWLEILLLVETLLLFAAAAGCEVPALGSLLALVLGVQILAVPAWGALGLLLGQITTRYMAAALLYGAVVEMGIGRIPTNINVLSILRHLQVLLSENAALHDFYAWPPGKVATALGAVILAPAIFLSAAAVLFSMVEYHHASEMQK